MIPSHTSGLCACTYHLFYNAPDLNWIVALQSFLTLIGNSTMAFAAYRIYAFEKDKQSPSSSASQEGANALPLPETNNQFLSDLLVKSLLLSLLVKYGELGFDFPFEASSLVASAFVVVPTLANINKWWGRSRDVSYVQL